MGRAPHLVPPLNRRSRVTMSTRLVVVVTGANSGVGFGVCHRLLVQLSAPDPPDARPLFLSSSYAPPTKTNDPRPLHAPPPHEGLTIIMACSDARRAEAARTQLYALLDQHISGLQQGSQERGYATTFRSNVKLELETLDLASMNSVVAFGKTVNQKYEYISHLILNAGTASYTHLDNMVQLYDMFAHPIFASTHPRSNVQRNGVMSDDNLGYVWQCNVFGHYCVYRSLQPLLSAYAQLTGEPARVIWMSSLVAAPYFDPVDDWQLTKTLHSYEGSKFQIDLIASELERLGIDARAKDDPSSLPDFISADGGVHHLISSPGVVPTNMMSLLGANTLGHRASAAFVFWVTRLLGCRHIHLTVYSCAVATVHLALAPLRSIPTSGTVPTVLPSDEKYPPWHPYSNLETEEVQTLRMGSEADRWGYEYTSFIAVPVWQEHRDFGGKLLEKCERLYQTFRTASSGGTSAAEGAAAVAN
ncbi:hypothetical protein GSI_12179 [Ganoderma sinense ZZ0214-1]|uniref:3-keto-steroid reductase n=1 Tax=Ganoderma sinense ZZ0214-1 TaxID=1077348 RepID=A0A2G8RY38_9APHY|nr:hypothetical protein GSI_12179 [Ganoderma sinense ZZ0214-1]